MSDQAEWLTGIGVKPEIAPKTRFSRRLGIILENLKQTGEYDTKLSMAKGLGIDGPRLSKLLNEDVIAGTKTVAQICSSLGREDAASLLQAFLLDEAETVRRLANRIGRLNWGKEQLVEIRTQDG